MIEIFFGALVLVAIAAWLLRSWSRRQARPNDQAAEPLEPSAASGPAEAALPDFTDLNEQFLLEAKGEAVIDLVRCFNPMDTAVLRSLLDGSGILSYCGPNTINKLYLGAAIQGLNDELVKVFARDQEAAREIAREFIADLRRTADISRVLPELL